MSQIDNARTLYECCPLCNSLKFQLIGEANCTNHPMYNQELPPTIRWQTCHDCGHSFSDGYFTEEALNSLFKNSNNNQILDITKMEQARASSAPMVDKISATLGKQQGKWLDVGFGNGSLLTTCAEYGFEAMGIDLRKEAVDKMKPLGIYAQCMEFTDFNLANTFAVISMADVLEHMPYPQKAIEKAYELLIPGGILFISCPNSDSAVWKSLTEHQLNPYWQEIEHYHNFGRKRLYSLLDKHHFKPINFSVSSRYRIGMEIISKK